MNGFERITAVLEGRKPDRKPVMLHNFMMAANEAGYTMEEFRSDPRKIADSFIQAVETYEYDGIMVDVDTATLAGAVGVPVDFPANEPARTHHGCLDSLDQVEALEPVDVSDYRPVVVWLEAVSLLKEYFGGEVFVRGNCDQAPFSLASMMRTPQCWMMDLLTDEENALQLLDYCAAVSCQFVTLMSKVGADMVSSGDSPAGPEMISPAMYERFALPYEKMVVDTAHSHGVPYALHVCGNATPILSLMPTSGADAIELDHKTDATKAKDAFEDEVTYIGNLDPVNVLAKGSRQDVVRETRKLMDIFGDSSRFIVNAGCAIPPSTPPENLKALVQTVRDGT